MTYMTEPNRTIRPLWEQAFLTVFAETGNIMLSCRAAQVGRTTVHDRRKADEEFEKRYQEARENAADVLEAEAWRRAKEGVNEPVIFKGELMGEWIDGDGNIVSPDNPEARKMPLTVKKYSDCLMIVLLKGCRPEKYRENVAMTVDGAVKLELVEEIVDPDHPPHNPAEPSPGSVPA